VGGRPTRTCTTARGTRGKDKKKGLLPSGKGQGEKREPLRQLPKRNFCSLWGVGSCSLRRGKRFSRRRNPEGKQFVRKTDDDASGNFQKAIKKKKERSPRVNNVERVENRTGTMKRRRSNEKPPRALEGSRESTAHGRSMDDPEEPL